MRNAIRIVVLLAVFVGITGIADATDKGGKGNEIRLVSPPALNSVRGTEVIFEEGFNVETPFPPAGWLIINRDGEPTPDNAWYYSSNIGTSAAPVAPYEGTGFAADYYGSANGFYIDDYLVSPNTGTPPVEGAVDSLVFYLASRLSDSGDYPDSLEIRVSTTDQDTASFTQVLGYVQAPKSVWTRFAFKLPQAATRHIAFRYLIYDGGPSGTNSDKLGVDAMQILRYTPTAVSEQGTEIPGSFALRQNYPNPFNPSTRIEFAVPTASVVRLTVFDALGRSVATLADEVMPAGVHMREFSASALSGGVYFVRMTAGSFTATRQMALVK